MQMNLRKNLATFGMILKLNGLNNDEGFLFRCEMNCAFSLSVARLDRLAFVCGM